MTAADDAREALRLAREALAAAQEAARAAGVEVSGAELTVQRINVVDPYGTLRMVLGNRHVADEIPVPRLGRLPRPRQPRRPDLRQRPGHRVRRADLVGDRQDAGTQLSFDSYEQDQSVMVLHADEGGVRRSVIEFIDQPAWWLADVLLREVGADEPREPSLTRMRLAKEADDSVGLTLSDPEGRPRLRLRVGADGEPSVVLLDEEESVAARLA